MIIGTLIAPTLTLTSIKGFFSVIHFKLPNALESTKALKKTPLPKLHLQDRPVTSTFK